MQEKRKIKIFKKNQSLQIVQKRLFSSKELKNQVDNNAKYLKYLD